VLEDWRSAPIAPRLRAALELVDAMTTRAQELGPDDVARARDAGLGDDDIRDAAYACYLFGIYDRLADALGWDVPTEGDGRFDAAGKHLLARGYTSMPRLGPGPDRFAALRAALEDAVLRGPGQTDAALRQAAAEAGEVPEELRAVLDKVRRHAYKVTDEDLAALRARWSQDQIFELVVAAAVGDARRRLEALLAALSSRRDRAA
jgi:alkylhydroperoxidase family enzyme